MMTMQGESDGRAPQALVLDLVEWVAREPRSYAEAMAAWRTSCPRLTVWEDALECGYVARKPTAAGASVVTTPTGEAFLRAHGRG
jgi:hypothetical protein